MKPFVITTSDTVSDFFNLSWHQSVYDVASRLEGYCLSGVKGKSSLYHSITQLTSSLGVVQSYQQQTLHLKAETAALILERLREFLLCFINGN